MRSWRRIARWPLAAIAIGVAMLGIQAFWLEPASLRVVEESITLTPPLSAPLRVAILTDLHIGSNFNGIDKLRDIVARTNAAQPDLICILGDLLSNGPRGARSDRPGFIGPEQVASELAHLRARVGVFGVLGNHDNWLDHDRVATALASNGVRVLEDKAARLETPAGSIWLAGVGDYWTRSHDIDAALSSIGDDTSPIILITHNPDLFPGVPDRVALTLAGHTHGGQVRFPFIGTPIVPSQFGVRFTAGHVVEGGRHLFVATGVGTSILPVRFRVPPAISVLTIE
jgi:predicted MPP superfamily phosphohydrolase